MSMRSIPDMTNAAAMARRGRLAVLREARADLRHDLQRIASAIQRDGADDAALIAEARELLTHWEALAAAEAVEYGR